MEWMRSVSYTHLTALFEVHVVGAGTKEDAVKLSKSVACSNLTKTAIAGHDANWGRIICAMGYSGAQFDPEKVDLFFESKAGKIQIAENGVALDFSEEKATEILSQSVVTATANVKMGEEEATAWGCDLTHGYICLLYTSKGDDFMNFPVYKEFTKTLEFLQKEFTNWRNLTVDDVSSMTVEYHASNEENSEIISKVIPKEDMQQVLDRDVYKRQVECWQGQSNTVLYMEQKDT